MHVYIVLFQSKTMHVQWVPSAMYDETNAMKFYETSDIEQSKQSKFRDKRESNQADTSNNSTEQMFNNEDSDGSTGYFNDTGGELIDSEIIQRPLDAHDQRELEKDIQHRTENVEILETDQSNVNVYPERPKDSDVYDPGDQELAEQETIDHDNNTDYINNQEDIPSETQDNTRSDVEQRTNSGSDYEDIDGQEGDAGVESDSDDSIIDEVSINGPQIRDGEDNLEDGEDQLIDDEDQSLDNEQSLDEEDSMLDNEEQSDDEEEEQSDDDSNSQSNDDERDLDEEEHSLDEQLQLISDDEQLLQDENADELLSDDDQKIVVQRKEMETDDKLQPDQHEESNIEDAGIEPINKSIITSSKSRIKAPLYANNDADILNYHKRDHHNVLPIVPSYKPTNQHALRKDKNNDVVRYSQPKQNINRGNHQSNHQNMNPRHRKIDPKRPIILNNLVPTSGRLILNRNQQINITNAVPPHGRPLPDIYQRSNNTNSSKEGTSLEHPTVMMSLLSGSYLRCPACSRPDPKGLCRPVFWCGVWTLTKA